MSGISEAEFYERIAAAPNAAKGFFESIQLHFGRRNDVLVHHTKARGGDLRLALPKGMYYENKVRNFATMAWQQSSNAVLTRTILTPKKCSQLGFKGGTVPVYEKEPLSSDPLLDENVWRNGARDFIKAFEAAKLKMLSKRGLMNDHGTFFLTLVTCS